MLRESLLERSREPVGRGRPLFGYESNGTPIESELQALEEVHELLVLEAISLREGAEFIFSVCGKPISHVGLRDRLAKGIRKHDRKEEETRET